MSREFGAAMKRAVAVEHGEEPTPEPAKPKAVRAKRPKSLTIKVQEMEKYDWNPSMRYLLLILVLGTRREKEDYSDTWVPENSPWTAEEMVGWCDQSQWRLAQRVGLTTDHINKMLAQLELDGFIIKEEWTDPDTMTKHCRYQVVEVTVDANQRPSHTAKTKRGPRFSKPRKANKGSFSKTNQPKISDTRRAIMEADDE
jgi:hypothetical protein